jgi:Glyoxalase-like domain
MAHRSRLAIVVIDTQQTQREAAVRFWSGAFGRTRRPADDPAARYAHLQTPAGPTLDVIIQGTTPEHAGIHLDIETDDVEAEVTRLEKLGARRKRFAGDWWVMEAPSGHAFCVIPVQTDTWPEGAIEWPDAP